MAGNTPNTPTADAPPAAPPDAELKARHRAMWASGDYPSMVETFLLPLGPRLVEAAGIGPGTRVLDVGAGTGNASLPAARAGAHVTASDLTPELLDAGRRGRRRRASRSTGSWPTRSACRSRTSPSTSSSPRSAPCSRRATRRSPTSCPRLPPGRHDRDAELDARGHDRRAVPHDGAVHAAAPPGAQPPPLWGSEEHVRGLFGARVELLAAAARRARRHGLHAAARLRRALQGPLRPDHRRPGQRAPQRPRGRSSTRRSTGSARSGTAARPSRALRDGVPARGGHAPEPGPRAGGWSALKRAWPAAPLGPPAPVRSPPARGGCPAGGGSAPRTDRAAGPARRRGPRCAAARRP